MADFRTWETPVAGQASTSSYVDVVLNCRGGTETIFPNQTFTPLSFHAWNTGVNAIDCKVLASNDRTLTASLWVDQALAGFTNLAANAAVLVSLPQPGFAFYRVQTQDHVSSSHGTANIALAKLASE